MRLPLALVQVRRGLGPICVSLGTLLVVACAGNKTLPSDRPFNASEYKANASPNLPQNTSAEGLVSTPTLAVTPATTKDGSTPFKFSLTCVDPDTNESFKADDPGYDACITKIEARQRKPTP